jgi:NADPH:quinone reductase-like Zn-dependent oxidoreductase
MSVPQPTLADKGKIQPGQQVLINGAAGGVGTFAVQIAKSFGAEATAVCSTRNLESVRSIGADRVIDYTQEDFTESRPHYDLILDNVGNHSLLCVIAGAPKEAAGFFLTRAITAPAFSRLVSQKFVMFIAKLNKEDLTVLRDLIKAGEVTPVIDRRYSLSEVPEAIRYLEAGHARGKVVITLE